MALVSGIAWLTIVAADVSGRGVDIVTSPGVVATVLTQTIFGQSLAARILVGVEIAALMLLYGLDGARLYRLSLAGLCVGFLACFAWSGHAAAAEDGAGILHRTSDALHAIAACAWVGGLAPLALFLRAALREADMPTAHTATLRFGMLGLVCVGVLIATARSTPGTLPARFPRCSARFTASFCSSRSRCLPRCCRLRPITVFVSRRALPSRFSCPHKTMQRRSARLSCDWRTSVASRPRWDLSSLPSSPGSARCRRDFTKNRYGRCHSDSSSRRFSIPICARRRSSQPLP